MDQFQSKVSGKELSRYDFIELEDMGFKDFNRPGAFCGGEFVELVQPPRHQ